MTIKTTAIAISTAAALAFGTLAPVSAVQAAPLAPFSSATGENATQITEVGGSHRRRGRRHGRRHHRRGHGAGVALGLGALAIGAAIAAQSARSCYVERVRVWSPRYRAYVIQEQRVC